MVGEPPGYVRGLRVSVQPVSDMQFRLFPDRLVRPRVNAKANVMEMA